MRRRAGRATIGAAAVVALLSGCAGATVADEAAQGTRPSITVADDSFHGTVMEPARHRPSLVLPTTSGELFDLCVKAGQRSLITLIQCGVFLGLLCMPLLQFPPLVVRSLELLLEFTDTLSEIRLAGSRRFRGRLVRPFRLGEFAAGVFELSTELVGACPE